MSSRSIPEEATSGQAPRASGAGLWRRALVGIPRVDAATWQRLDLATRWLVAARAGVLVITLIPCVIAGLLAFRDGAFDPALWTLCTVGPLLAHATNNLINDLTDYLKGVDRGNYFRTRYGTQPLEQGLMTVRQSVRYAVITGGLALAIGLYLTSIRGPQVLALLGAGAFFVLFYTWPLKYIGLGELAVLVVWGPLMIGGAYLVTSGHWSSDVAWASLPYALGATTVLFGKHIDKLDQDREKGIRTLPVLIGRTAARWAAIVMMALGYVLTLGLVVAGVVGPALLLVLLGIPKLVQAIRIYAQPPPESCPESYPEEAWPLWYVSFAFVHNRAFGGLFVLGLVLDVVVSRLLLA